MRINYNLSAMITNSQLFRNEKGQQSAAERLASGLKINHAKDDPAGMAISNKMDVQIEGIRQASRNSSDGISVLESADSSLNEVTNIIQRMRELAVQAASDTNQIEDRQAIQSEIDSLSVEIDRISKNTEFNKKVLLDGSLSRRSYTNNNKVTVTNIGQGVPTDNYGITITADARQAVFKGVCCLKDYNISPLDNAYPIRLEEVKEAFDDTDNGGKLKAEAAGTVNINGVLIELEEGDSFDKVYEKLRTGAEQADITCIATNGAISMEGYNTKIGHPTYSYFGSTQFPDPNGRFEETAGYMPNPAGWNPMNEDTALVFISKDYGSSEKVNISCDNALLAAGLGLAKRYFTGATGSPSTTIYDCSASGTKTSSAEIKCYRSSDMYLADMPNPPVVLDPNNPAHKKYYEDHTIAGDPTGKKIPALYNGTIIDLDEHKELTTFYDKVDYLPEELTTPLINGSSTGTDPCNIRIENGNSVAAIMLTEGMTAQEVFNEIKTKCNAAGIDVYLTDDVRMSSYTTLDEAYNYSQALVFRSRTDGTELSIETRNIKLAQMIGLPLCEWSVEGVDAKATFMDDPDTSETDRLGFSNSATITTKGNKIIATDRNGFEIEMEASKKTCGTYYADYSTCGRDKGYGVKSGDEYGSIAANQMGTLYPGFPDGLSEDIVAEVTGYGMMTVHVGANENQIIDMDIPKVDCESLDIDGLNVRSGWTADKALTKLDAALIEVSKVRSRLGAYQNRLESTVNSLNANDEDLTASVSRIRDVDMAQETTEYTQYTILVQAATSVLAQANELPQQALQLIQ